MRPKHRRPPLKTVPAGTRGAYPPTRSDHRPRAMAPLHGQTGSCSAAGAIEDVKLRQRLFEVFSGSKKRAHSDLYRAQKHMRQPRAGGAAG